MLSDLRFRLRALFRRRVVETELDQELRFHFENEVEKYKSRGMAPEEALRLARLSFGGHDQIKEDCREARGTNLLESCLDDIRYGLRVLCKNPGVAIVAVLTLSLGVGASAIIYSLVDTILLRPLPYPNAGRVAMLLQVAPAGSFFGTQSIPWEPQEFRLLGKHRRPFRTWVRSPPTFSVDGKNLYYLLRRRSSGLGAELWRMTIDTGKSEAVFPESAILAYDVSPDGRQVVYSTGNSAGKSRLWIAPIDRANPPKQIGDSGETLPHFGPRGEILFQMTAGASNYVEQMNQDGSHRSRATIEPLAEAAVVPGAQSIPRDDLVPGADLSHFAYVKTTVHRNLYRVSLP